MLVSTYVVMAGFRYYEENKEKRYLRHAFEHYLHPSVIASVVDQSAKGLSWAASGGC